MLNPFLEGLIIASTANTSTTGTISPLSSSLISNHHFLQRKSPSSLSSASECSLLSPVNGDGGECPKKNDKNNNKINRNTEFTGSVNRNENKTNHTNPRIASQMPTAFHAPGTYGLSLHHSHSQQQHHNQHDQQPARSNLTLYRLQTLPPHHHYSMAAVGREFQIKKEDTGNDPIELTTSTTTAQHQEHRLSTALRSAQEQSCSMSPIFDSEMAPTSTSTPQTPTSGNMFAAAAVAAATAAAHPHHLSHHPSHHLPHHNQHSHLHPLHHHLSNTTTTTTTSSPSTLTTSNAAAVSVVHKKEIDDAMLPFGTFDSTLPHPVSNHLNSHLNHQNNAHNNIHNSTNNNSNTNNHVSGIATPVSSMYHHRPDSVDLNGRNCLNTTGFNGKYSN